MELRKVILASAVAGLFVAGGAVTANADSHEGGAEAEKIHCEGMNGCKGQSECATDHSSCNGHNECSGKGWIEMTPEECEAAKAAKADK